MIGLQSGTAKRWLGVLALSLALSVTTSLSISASDGSVERARLTAILRELAAIERIARESKAGAPKDGTRYYFDYARLQADLARVRSGIEDYLSPPRAQPRDLQVLSGEYRHEAPTP